MKISVRKTTSGLYISYKSGDYTNNLSGEDFRMNINNDCAVMFIDLSSNVRTNKKDANRYLDAIQLSEQPADLKLLQLDDERIAKEFVRLYRRADHLPLRLHLRLDDSTSFRYAASIDNLEDELQINIEHFISG